MIFPFVFVIGINYAAQYAEKHCAWQLKKHGKSKKNKSEKD
jgi:hypothetical protein